MMILLCAMTALLLISSYILCSLYSGNLKTAFLGALTVWAFSTIGLAVRPQMIGYIFLVIELLLMTLGHTRDRRWLYGLPLLFAVWVNCHASFALGLGIFGIVSISTLFSFQIGLLGTLYWKHKQRQSLIIAFLFSSVAVFLNPDGIQQVLYPLKAMLALPLNLSLIQEWQPLQMNHERGIALLAILACTLLTPILYSSTIFLHELLLLILGAGLAISHTRMLFVFGILAAPILSRLIAPLWDNYDASRDHPYANGAFIITAIAVTIFVFPNQTSIAQQIEAGSPVNALKFIRSHHLHGKMMNAYKFGGYLIWSAPDYPVFVDGRGDLFESSGVLAQLRTWALVEEDPRILLNRWHIRFCLLEKHSPIVNAMLLIPEWKAVYSDDVAVVFIRSESLPSPMSDN